MDMLSIYIDILYIICNMLNGWTDNEEMSSHIGAQRLRSCKLDAIKQMSHIILGKFSVDHYISRISGNKLHV